MMLYQDQNIRNLFCYLMLICIFFQYLQLDNTEYKTGSLYVTVIFAWGLVFSSIKSVGAKIGSAVILLVPILLLHSMLASGMIRNTATYLSMVVPLFLVGLIFPPQITHRLLEAVCQHVLVFYVFIYSLPMDLGVDYSYGYSRLQGFLSEPSALALPVAILGLAAVRRKSIFSLALVATVTYLAKSPTVMVILATCLLLLVLIRINFLAILLSAFSALLLLPYTYVRSQFLTILISLVEMLRDMGMPLYRVQQGLLFVQSAGEVGRNTRFDNNFFESGYFSYWGHGLNNFFEEDLRDWNFHLELMYGVGGIGWGLCIVWIVTVLARAGRRNDLQWLFLVTLSVFVYVSLNSAMGLAFHGVFFLMLGACMVATSRDPSSKSSGGLKAPGL